MPVAERPWFTARRLGHVNLYISNYEKSLDFYRRVIGLHDGWTRPKIQGAFLNNGASHHDIGFLPWHSPERRVVVSGPGLNHLAFDVGTEADLASGYRSAGEAGHAFLATADHVVSKSLYCNAPNGMQLEIYADTPITFRDPDFLEMRRATTPWDPATVDHPDARPYYVQTHAPTPSPGTVFQASRIDGATIVVDDLHAVAAYFQRSLGLSPSIRGPGDTYVLLQGALGGRDLVVFAATAESPPGLHHFSFLVLSEAGFEESLRKARAEGVDVVREIDVPEQRGVVLRDPDGMIVKLFVDRQVGFWRAWRARPAAEALWLL